MEILILSDGVKLKKPVNIDSLTEIRNRHTPNTDQFTFEPTYCVTNAQTMA